MIRRGGPWMSVGVLAMFVAGCGNFEDVTTVIDLRVLAIAAEPPEIVVDPMHLDGPFQTTLTALVGDPTGQARPISVDVLACPRQIDAVTAATGRNGVVCKPFDPQSTDPDASVAVTPSSAPPMVDRTPFGDGEIALPFVFPQDLLLRAYRLDPFAQLGFQMPITFQFVVAAGDQREIATKRMIFAVAPPDHPDQPANSNPHLTGLSTYVSRDDQGMPVDPQPFELDHPPEVPLGGSLWFEPEGADGQAETYFTRALTREANPQVVVNQLKETLRYAFYTSAGSWSPPSTITAPPIVREQPERVHLESRYRAPTVMPADPNVTFWVIVRDERGGASWTKGRLTLVTR